MRKVLLVIGLLLLGQGSVLAEDCPPGTVLKVIGQVQTDDANVSTGGHKVRASRVSCAGTACVAGLYNADTVGASGNATVKDEPGAAANTSTWTEYNPPLDFDEGITAIDDANVNAVLVYECR